MPTYEKNFRKALGFTNQEKLKKYFKATDFQIVNWERIKELNIRLKDMSSKINDALSPEIRNDDIAIIHKKIDEAFQIIKDNDLFPHLNNQGRNPDDVYYNWMRGYIICELFIKAISILFNVNESKINHIGKDDLSNIDTFSRSATADLQINTENETIRLEIQGGYTGINDIKRSKITEAKNNYSNKIKTYILHIDIFNGKAALVDIFNPNSSKLVYTKNSRFEGIETLSIKHEWFTWKLSDTLPDITSLITTL